MNVTYEPGISPPSVSVCRTTANPDGTFICLGNIPTSNAGPAGDHKIKPKGTTSLATAKTTFTLTERRHTWRM